MLEISNCIKSYQIISNYQIFDILGNSYFYAVYRRKLLFFAENITIPMVIAVVVIALLLVVSHMEKQLVKDLAAVKAGEQK